MRFDAVVLLSGVSKISEASVVCPEAARDFDVFLVWAPLSLSSSAIQGVDQTCSRIRYLSEES